MLERQGREAEKEDERKRETMRESGIRALHTHGILSSAALQRCRATGRPMH